MKKLYIPLLLLITQSVWAQQVKEVTHQNLIWVRYYNKINLGPWSIHTEIEDRRYVFPDRQHQLLLPRIHLHHSLGKAIDVAAGFTYFLQSTPQVDDQPTDLIVPELRPHQELTYKTKLHPLDISHRYRLEERFFRNTVDDQLVPGYRFNFRMRYQLQVQYPLIIREDKKGNLDIKVYDEIMLNLGRSIVYNTFDQNRIGIGLQYGLLESVQIQLDALNWFQQRSNGEDYYSRMITRFTLSHTLN